MFQKKPGEVTESYQASGRFAPMFLPMLAVAGCIALAMAYVLHLAGSRNLYYYFVAPLLVSAPALGAIALAVYVGKCRNTLLGGVAGLLVMMVFYVGYWQITYQQTMGRLGPLGQVILKSKTGVGGLPGYFLFRCRTTRPSSSHDLDRTPREPTAVDAVFNYAFFGGELVMLTLMGWAVGRTLAGRVFYEKADRWGSSFSFRLAPKDEAAGMAAIEAQDWAGLANLPKVAHEFGQQQNAGAMRVKAEFLKGAADPSGSVYVTVWPSGRKSVSGLMTLLDKLSTSQWRQRAVMGESAARFVLAFAKEMETKPVASAPRTVAGAATADVAVMAGDPRAIRDALVAQGECDGLRVEAVDPGAVKRVRRFAWAFTIAIACSLALGLGGAIASLAVGTGDGKDHDMTPLQIALATVFVVGMVCCVVTVTVFWKIRYALLRRELKRRPGSLIGSMRRSQAFRVYFAKEFHLKEKALEDIAFVGPDGEGQLLIEGIRHRYVLPAAAVRQVEPVQSDSTLAIQVDFEAMQRQVQIILARDNMKGHWQGHVPMLSAANDARKVADWLREGLGVQSQAGRRRELKQGSPETSATDEDEVKKR